MVVVVFEEEGALGISWTHRREDGAAIVKTIRAGSNAEKAIERGLSLGQILVAVNGKDSASLGFKGTIDVIRNSRRPLKLTLEEDSDAFKVDETTQQLKVTIIAPGPMGMRLESNGGAVRVASCAPDSMSCKIGESLRNHGSLLGMRVLSIQSAGMPEQQATHLPLPVVTGIIDSGKRPVSLVLVSERITVSFTQPGPLGLSFASARGGTAVHLQGVKPGTHGTTQRSLVPGLRLVEVGGNDVVQLKYEEVIKKIKAAGRPLDLVFTDGSAEPPQAIGSHDAVQVEATFSKRGTLGLKLSPVTGKVEDPGVKIAGLNPGTQADDHPQLRPGMVFVSMHDAHGSTVRLANLTYSDVVGKIKKAGRPIKFCFVGPSAKRSTATDSGAPTKRATPVDAAVADAALVAQKKEEEEVSNSPEQNKSPASTSAEKVKEMQLAEEAEMEENDAKGTPTAEGCGDSDKLLNVTFTEQGPLGMHFKQGSTGDMKLVSVTKESQAARHPELNEGLLVRTVAGKSVFGLGYQQSLAAIKKAGRPLTIGFVERHDYSGSPKEAPAAPAATPPQIQVTFTENGSLGLKFSPQKATGNVQLLAVNSGTQAEKHAALRPGLVLATVADVSVAGKSYQDVIGLIKAGGRPLTLGFLSGGAVPGAQQIPAPAATSSPETTKQSLTPPSEPVLAPGPAPVPNDSITVPASSPAPASPFAPASPLPLLSPTALSPHGSVSPVDVAEMASMQARVRQLTNKLERMESSNTVTRLQEQLRVQKAVNAEARAHAAAADERLQAGVIAVQRLRENRRAEVAASDQEIEELKQKLSALTKKSHTQQEKLEASERKVQALELQLAATEAELEENETPKEDGLQAIVESLRQQLAQKDKDLLAEKAKPKEGRLQATVESLRQQLEQKDKDLLVVRASIRPPARQQRGGGGFCGAKPKKH